LKWSEEKIEFLKENYSKLTDKELAEEIGTTPASVRKKRRLLGLTKPLFFRKQLSPKNALPEPVFIDKKRAENINWREWFDNLQKRQELHQKTSSSQDEATVKIETEKKIAVVFSADWHMGSVSVDYKELQHNLDTILNTDRVYMITVGDLIDNFRSFRSLQPILSQIASPKEQRIILSSILNEFIQKKKWIAACWGNHDIERDERLYGESTIKNLLSEHLIYFNGKGTLNLIVGKEKYIIRLSHEFKGHSIYNPNHPMNRELKWNAPFADVIVGAHRHQPAVQWFYEYGKPKCLIQVGTFQTDDGYAKRWWTPGIIGVPTVVFHPDKHFVFVYPSLNELLQRF